MPSGLSSQDVGSGRSSQGNSGAYIRVRSGISGVSFIRSLRLRSLGV